MSPAGALKRELVTLLLFLARQIGITLSASRDSLDGQVEMTFRKMILRVHLDRLGGSMEHAKKVNDAWAKRQGTQRARGRPSSTATPNTSSASLVVAARSKKPSKKQGYRVRGPAVMLTYAARPEREGRR